MFYEPIEPAVEPAVETAVERVVEPVQMKIKEQCPCRNVIRLRLQKLLKTYNHKSTYLPN